MRRNSLVAFQRAKEERLLLKILRNIRHSWIGRTVRRNKFVVNIHQGPISGKIDATHGYGIQLGVTSLQ
jgi:hypothetical protein